MAELLKGAPVAAKITENLALEVEALKAKGIVPKLEILRVGEKDGDLAYERGALSRMGKVGVEVKQVILPSDASKSQILSEIEKANNDKSIHGILMFRPLDLKEAEEEASRLIDPKKDCDAMSLVSLASTFLNLGYGFPPCTAQSVIEILKFYNIPLAGANVVVIGRSAVIGKPVSMLLQNENATVTMCHSKTKDLKGICKKADIIIAAIGKGKMIDKDYVSEGQVVIDVGINTDKNGNLCGDCDFDSIEPIVKAITPVPGGVGSVTTSILASHVVNSAK